MSICYRNYQNISSKFDKRARSEIKLERHQARNDIELDDSVNSNTIGGYAGGRKTRCTDKFVRYPYPSHMNSYYRKEFKDKINNTIILKKGEAFNLEKEAKIINPH